MAHDTPGFEASGGKNVGFGSRHPNFGEWLHADMNLATPDHVK